VVIYKLFMKHVAAAIVVNRAGIHRKNSAAWSCRGHRADRGDTGADQLDNQFAAVRGYVVARPGINFQWARHLSLAKDSTIRRFLESE
jgi:hypothetical protein